MSELQSRENCLWSIFSLLHCLLLLLPAIFAFFLWMIYKKTGCMEYTNTITKLPLMISPCFILTPSPLFTNILIDHLLLVLNNKWRSVTHVKNWKANLYKRCEGFWMLGIMNCNLSPGWTYVLIVLKRSCFLKSALLNRIGWKSQNNQLGCFWNVIKARLVKLLDANAIAISWSNMDSIYMDYMNSILWRDSLDLMRAWLLFMRKALSHS